MSRLLPWLSVVALVGSPLSAAPVVSIRDSGAFSAMAAARALAPYGNVTSTYRTVAHNRAVGGVANSYHLQGRAVDLARRAGVTHRQLDAALRSAGYNVIESLDEGDHSHFAFGPLNGRLPAISAAAPAAVAVAYPAPPEPAKPEAPRLLADEHGTLHIDLSAKGPASGPATP